MRLQLEAQGGKYKIEGNSLKSRLLFPNDIPGSQLKYPVFFGDEGELISIMESKDTFLGKGKFGRVYLGFNIDTGKHAFSIGSA